MVELAEKLNKVKEIKDCLVGKIYGQNYPGGIPLAIKTMVVVGSIRRAELLLQKMKYQSEQKDGELEDGAVEVLSGVLDEAIKFNETPIEWFNKIFLKSPIKRKIDFYDVNLGGVIKIDPREISTVTI